MNQQIITTPKGERMVVLPEAEYVRLLEALEDIEDRNAVRQFKERLAAGDEELLSAAMVDAILEGESRVRVWREHRGLTAAALAKAAGIASPYLSQIETGKREGTVETYRKLAIALGITLDDLLG
jgi:DNA-binding XRE family transcriptional regulator